MSQCFKIPHPFALYCGVHQESGDEDVSVFSTVEDFLRSVFSTLDREDEEGLGVASCCDEDFFVFFFSTEDEEGLVASCCDEDFFVDKSEGSVVVPCDDLDFFEDVFDLDFCLFFFFLSSC